MMGGNGLRAALYHRLHCLLPLASNTAARRFARLLVWGFWLIYFTFVLLVLVLRYAILPHIEDYRPHIERLVSQGIGQKVGIGRIEASWAGLNPDLTLHEVRVADAEGRPALAFSRVEAVLSWWSLPSAQLRLRLLRINEPTLHLRRNAEGRYFIAGIPLNQDGSDSDVAAWVLEQRRIRIDGATLVWDDELRQAPTLVLEDVNLALDNDGRRHRFGLTAQPPDGLAARIDIRGDFRGNDIERMEKWSGQAYAEFDYADLAVWRQWVDYPVALPHGHGALRAWAGFSGGALQEITADVSLQDVHLKLAQDLPELELERMSGRLQARFPETGLAVKGERIELVSGTEMPGGAGSPLKIEPTDFEVAWQPEAGGKNGVGNVSITRMDLGMLARLAAYLPIDTQSRTLLNDYAPRGLVNGLSARWKNRAENLLTYSLKAGVQDLGVAAQGKFPGFSGLSGTLEASEKGGKLALRSGKSSIDLPGVFPESLMRFDSLVAQARWKFGKEQLEVDLTHAEFAGPQAAGSAQGTYRTAADGPGSIDMTAALTRADARAVWSYMPHVVGEGARHWLHDSLLAGKAGETKLILKGNLRDFPFLDKSKGQFLVTVKANDVTVDYGKGWPRIEGIYGELRFEGNGMLVEAQRGRILGVRLSNTQVRIPDFHAPVSTLYVKGQADGPTSEFLKFIDQSPVADQIDRFTEGMRASGNGHLDIDLVIPLAEARLDESKISGAYRFTNNEITVDPVLPPLRQLNGSIQFSGSDLRVPEINAVLFGGPLKIQGGLQKDGRVLITLNGSANIAQMRKQADHPLLARLSGTTPYRGEVRINKRNADLVVESSLAGMVSTLPEPFGKTAGEALPLRFEKKFMPALNLVGGSVAPAARDQISATVGQLLALQLIRRKDGEAVSIEKGAIAVGRPLQLPEKGLLLSLGARRLDLDAWQKALGLSAANAAGDASPLLRPDAVSLQAADLVLFGHHLHDVDLWATPGEKQWKIRLNSRQAAGDLVWEDAGNGRLVARLSRLAIDRESSPESSAPASEPTQKLPALDVMADDFSLRQLRFGKFELQARNEGGLWRLNRVHATNPFGTFTGSGQWQGVGGTNRTQLAFRLDSDDVGNLLGRMGYPGAVRAGTARIEGNLGWNGAPTDPDFASMSGDMNLEAGKGQFLKLDPGAAGKLVGLISLQNLPRRIALDFKDVFSEGFAFDSMASKLSVQKGVMRTDRLQIDGPSARVVMRGEVDLKRETQRLNVNVQPELGNTAALGVAIVNPAAGVATWLAHKILQNPLNQMFGYDYLITGTWDDPKVEKLSKTAPAGAMSAPGVANEPAR